MTQNSVTHTELPAWVGEELNRRAFVESELRKASKVAGLTAHECAELAVKLSVPDKYRKEAASLAARRPA